MSTGKYSPTVTASYLNNQDWWRNHKSNPDDWVDCDGYDQYGYHADTNRDRAGYTEEDYLSDGRWELFGEYEEEYIYPLYERIAFEWSNKIIA